MKLASDDAVAKLSCTAIHLSLIAFMLLVSFDRIWASELPNRLIYDSDFPDAAWRHDHDGSNEIAVTVRQTNPDIGGSGYLQTTIKGFDGVSVVTYKAYHYSLSAFYVPLTNGPIGLIRWDAYFQTYIGGHYLNLVARQGDGVYASPHGAASQQDISTWTHHAAVIDPSTFELVRGSGPSRLDFSSCGAPIFFGYVNYNDSGIRGTISPNCEPGGCLLPGGIFHLARFQVQIIPSQEVGILRSERTPSGNLRVIWPSVLGQTYEVLFALDIDSANWSVVASGQAGACQTYVDIPPSLRQGFFRVRRL